MKNVLIYLIAVFSLTYAYGLEKPKSNQISNYDTVKICNQVWMSRNLDVDHYRNGDSIPEVTDPTAWAALKTGAWCCYNNDPAMGAIYGKLYNWYAVNDPRGLAPEGWHVPIDGEWKELEICLGMSQSEADNRIRGGTEGGKLKSTGTKEEGDGLWLSPNTGATNESGFCALPGGSRVNDGDFGNSGHSSVWWSSSNYNMSDAWYRSLNYYTASVSRDGNNKGCGFTVRCVKDDSLNSINLFRITPDSTYIGDEVTITGKNFCAIKGTNFVAFRGAHVPTYISWSDTLIKVKVPVGTQTGKVSVTVKGNKSNEVDFTLIGDSVKICNQVWMSRNLDVDHYRNGDPIPEVTDPIAWGALNHQTGAWCYYNNDPAMGAIYGKLYNWYAVNDPRGLAPEGWHIPSDAEWTELVTCLGGSDVAGGKLKSTGTKEDGDGLWLIPNTGATNESGFSALPGGERSLNGSFNGFFQGNWWSSTENSSVYALFIFLTEYSARIGRDSYYRSQGNSVRCVKGNLSNIQNENKVNHLDDFKINITPNPVSDKAIIEYNSLVGITTKVEIYDLRGLIVKTIVSVPNEIGLNSIEFDTKDLNSGVYFIVLQNGIQVSRNLFLINK